MNRSILKLSSIKQYTIFIVFCSFFTSCDKNESNETANLAKLPKPIVWDWNNYAQATEMHLSTIPVDIQPKESYEIKSEASGIITFEVSEKNTIVKKDQVIARMDVEGIKEQETRLKIQIDKTKIETMRADELDIPEKKKLANEELEAARKKVRLYKLMLNNPAVKEYSAELLGDKSIIDDKAMQDAEDSLSLAEKKFAFAEEFEKKIQDGDRTLQEMETEESKRTLDIAKERSLYIVPFDGELRLEVNFVNGQQAYTVVSRDTVATLNNYDEIHAHLKVANSDWISLDPSRLYLQLSDKNNTLLEFKDDRIGKDIRTGREERKYIFSVPLKENTQLKRLTGTQMNSTLIYRLPEQCYIVPKYDISLYSLGKTDSIVWQDVVEKLWPNAKLLGVGHKHLAIKY